MTTAQRHTRTLTVTCMTAVELGGLKAGGLSLTSETSMLIVTVDDMAGEPLSNACTDKEYLETWREQNEIRAPQHLYVLGTVMLA